MGATMTPCPKCYNIPTFKHSERRMDLACACDSVWLGWKPGEPKEMGLSDEALEAVLVRAWAEKHERAGAT